MKLSSLSARLGLASSITSAILVIAIATMSYFAITRQLDIRAHEAVVGKVEQIKHIIDEFSTHSDIKLSPHALQDQIMGHANLTLEIYDSPDLKEPILRIGPATIDHSNLAISMRTELEFSTQILDGGNQTLTAYQEIKPRNLAPLYLALSYNRVDDYKLLTALGKNIAVGIPIVLIIVGFGAWFMVQRSLKPLRDFSQVAATVRMDNLSQRIEVGDLPDELRELRHSMNFMLHRLDSDVQQLIQFSDDLAHELRSPIANLLGKAQVALSRPRSTDDYQSVLVYSIEELERLSALVSQLLFLANVTNLQSPLKLVEIDLRAETKSVIELFSPEAEDRNITILINGDATVNGDQLMIRRAVSNLLSNALRHSAESEPIHISIKHRDKTTRLEVSNGGDHIPAAHLEKIFDRFYRVEASRSREQGGTGLGLAIVRSIMSLHDGRVEVASKPGLTTFTLVFS